MEEIKQLPQGLLSEDEQDHIRVALSEINDASIEKVAGFESSIENILERIWYPEKVAERERVDAAERQRLADLESKRRAAKRERLAAEGKYNEILVDELNDVPVMYSIRKHEPEWYIAFTSDFKNSLRKVDQNMRGRILGALSYLVESPSTSNGDTVKPLSRDLRGLWRYRIGDYRLIYKPDESSRHIYILAFLPRGSAYDV